MMPAKRHLPRRESHKEQSARFQKFPHRFKETVFLRNVLNDIMHHNQVKTPMQMRDRKNISSNQFNIRITLGMEHLCGIGYSVLPQIHSGYPASPLYKRSQIAAHATADFQHPHSRRHGQFALNKRNQIFL